MTRLDNRYPIRTPQDVVNEELRRLRERVEQRYNTNVMSIPVVDTTDYIDPTPGEVVIDHPTESLAFYWNGAWFFVNDGIVRVQLKLFSETAVMSTGDNKTIFHVTANLDNATLVEVVAMVSTVSSSSVLTVQVRNVTAAVDMLSTAITIDANEFNSTTAATPPVINSANSTVNTNDRIAIDVDGIGTNARGLTVELGFKRNR